MAPELLTAIIGAIATILAAVIGGIIARGKKKDGDSRNIGQQTDESTKKTRISW